MNGLVVVEGSYRASKAAKPVKKRQSQASNGNGDHHHQVHIHDSDHDNNDDPQRRQNLQTICIYVQLTHIPSHQMHHP